ncbi:unknown [Prevotella sp. CAG:755]|nr:unknown [Prevotella sp. CAG:755]
MHAGTQHPLQLFSKQGITVKVLSEWLPWLFGMYQSYFHSFANQF